MDFSQYLNPLNIEDLKKKFQNATPFPFVVIDHFLKEEFAEEIYSSFPSFNDAQKMGFEFKAVNELKKVQVTDTKQFPSPIQNLNMVLASPEFVSMVGEFTSTPKLLADPELVGGGIHLTSSGGHLDVHVDFNYIEKRKLHRRLNILVFFNKIWEKEWGGYTDFWDQQIKVCHHSLAPIFNRCIIFETSNISFHGVTPIQCPSNQCRKSFAAYYYTLEAPAHWKGESHTTIFKARPHEKFKGYIQMPAEKMKNWGIKYLIPKSILPKLVKIKQKIFH